MSFTNKPFVDYAYEFKTLYDHFQQPHYQKEWFADPQCPSVNRYYDVLTYGKTAAKTDDESVTCKNFLHANYIPHMKDPDRKSVFVASQAPLPQTISAFFAVVFRLPIFLIISILPESEMTPTHVNFWKEPQWIPTLFLYTTLKVNFDNPQMTVRNTSLWQMKNPKPRNYYHMHIKWWIDRDAVAPSSYRLLIGILKWIRIFHYKHKSLTLIHCSAGIGRTGTLIATYFIYDSFLEQWNEQRTFNFSIFALIMHLRSYRSHMVQTLGQYQFLYDFASALPHMNLKA